ncbi:MAG: transporter [Tatlockia sp.]|jgi:anthranilate 1,2-dioxygenase (deaminating, decarboxylating) large subunit
MKDISLRGLLGLSLIVLSTLAFAYDEPVVNLGYTSFLDGGPPAGPGLYFQDYFQVYRANRLNDKNGNKLPFPRTDLDATVNITQLIYLTKKELLGGKLGFSAVWPWVLDINVHDGLPHHRLDAVDGASDLFIGPAIQYDPIMRKDGKGPRYVQRVEVDFVAPVGRYNRYAISPSTNFFSLNPYWAATLWITPKWAGSFRLHYLWNAKNYHPKVSFGPDVHSTQAGQAVFANFATDYEINEKLHAGLNGYVFNQITDTKANGIDYPGRREKVWAIGPGMLYSITKNQFVFLNLYSEFGARNHSQGTNGLLRYVFHFH